MPSASRSLLKALRAAAYLWVVTGLSALIKNVMMRPRRLPGSSAMARPFLCLDKGADCQASQSLAQLRRIPSELRRDEPSPGCQAIRSLVAVSMIAAMCQDGPGLSVVDDDGRWFL